MPKELLYEFRNRRTEKIDNRKYRYTQIISPSFKVFKDNNIITHQTRNSEFSYTVPKDYEWRITGGNFEDIFINVNSKYFTYEVEHSFDLDLKDNQEAVDTLEDKNEMDLFVERRLYNGQPVPEGKKLIRAEDILNFRRKSDNRVLNKLIRIKGFDNSGNLVRVKRISRLGNKINIEFEKEVAIVDPQWTDQPDASDGIDNRINEGITYGYRNYGITNSVYIGYNSNLPGQYRSLIKFLGIDNNIPDNAEISNAKITFTYYSGEGTPPDTCYFYNLKRVWVEGTKNNVNGVSNWYYYDDNKQWETPGAFGDNDVDKSVSDTTTNLTWSGTDDVDIVNCIKKIAGQDKTYTNNGFLFKRAAGGSGINYGQWCSSDHTTASSRPKIEVNYTLPPGQPYAMRKRYLYQPSLKGFR